MVAHYLPHPQPFFTDSTLVFSSTHKYNKIIKSEWGASYEQRSVYPKTSGKNYVMKKLYNPDLVELYAANPESWTPCTHFEVGDEFITDLERPWDMPEGFCGWAWADIQRTVYGMARGGQDVFVTCCTDGYRPVIFKLEKL